MSARIGIPLCLDATGRIRAPRRYHYVHAAYAEAVHEAGGVPLYLPLPGAPETLLDGIDGLLIPGGDDLPPPRPYPGDVHFDLVPEAQLAFDRALLAAARTRALPILGICYGMQLLALDAGGRLHHHVPHDVPDAGEHRLDEATGRHDVRVAADSRLAALVGAKPGPVNSLHHQAVAEPGDGLEVCARAEDGLIEALEAPHGPFRLGVQWHPELLAGAHRQRLFGGFVAAASGRTRG